MKTKKICYHSPYIDRPPSRIRNSRIVRLDKSIMWVVTLRFFPSPSSRMTSDHVVHMQSFHYNAHLHKR